MHPFAELSAYQDSALDAPARARLAAHLASCQMCQERLAELRGTARLIAALPDPLPGRSLVPRVAVPFWLAPLRTLSAAASGVAMLVFVASIVLSGLSGAQSAGGAAATAANRSRTAQNAPAPAPTAAPGAPFGAVGTAQTQNERGVAAASATPGDAVKALTPTASPAARADVPTASPDALTLRQLSQQPAARPPAPWVWLALAIAFAALALILQWRLRAA